MHLLVVLIGAAYLARAKRRRSSDRGMTFAVNCHRLNQFCYANLLTEPVGVSHYLVVGAVLFVCGAVCMATKRNALGVLMGIELVLNGANVNFIAFGSPYLRADAGDARAGRPVDRPVRHRAGRGRSGRGPGHRAELLQQPQHDRRRSG